MAGTSSPCCFSKEKFENLVRFYEKSILTDVVIRLKDASGRIKKEYPVHSIILALSSPVFEASFTNFNEKVIEINDANVEAMDLFIKFLYTSEISLDSVISAWSVYHLADKYLIERLKQICTDFIVKNTGKENICSSFEISKVFNDQLHEKFKKMLFDEFPSILDSEDFVTLSSETLFLLLDQSDLKVKESELFKAVNLWVKNYLSEKDEEENLEVEKDEEEKADSEEKNKERPKIVIQILDSLFFYDMSPQEFAEVSTLGMLTMEESHAILVNLSTKNAPLPWPEGFRKCSRKNKNEFNTNDTHTIDFTEGVVNAQPESSLCHFTVNKAIAIIAIEISSVEEPPDSSLNYKEELTMFLTNAATNEMSIVEFSDIVNYGSSIRMVFKEPFGLTDDNFIHLGIHFNQKGCRRSQILEGTLSYDDITFTFVPSEVPNPLPILSIEFSKLF